MIASFSPITPLSTPPPLSPSPPSPGYNEWGQLGIGRVCEGLQPPRLVRLFHRHEDEGACDEGRVAVTQVACGGMHTAAVDGRGDV